MSQPVLVPYGTPFGPYRLLKELGRGGMGVVYLAEVGPGEIGLASGVPDTEPASHDMNTEELLLLPPGTRVAVKTFHPHLVSTTDFARRFRREAKVGASIRHENVVRTFDAGTAPLLGAQTNFIAMEFVEGQTLRSLMDEHGRVPPELARQLLRQVAAGIGAIHAAGITHRDLKPENVILTKDHKIKLMDLGVAKLREESIRLSLTGQFLGTVHYASPEQFRTPEAVDGRTDLYALGVMLHEVLTGENPFFHDDLRVVLRRTLNEIPRRASQYVPDIDPVLDQLAATLMEKEPADRVQSAAEVQDILDRGDVADWWTSRGRRLWAASAGRVVRKMPVARESPFTGRDAETAELRKAFDLAASGQRRAVWIEGEAGVGKTRLVDEFATSLAERSTPVTILFGTAPAAGTGRPFHALTEALLQAVEGRPPAEALAELLPPGAPAAAFAALLAGDAETGIDAERARPLFAAAFRKLAEKAPVLLVVDDLQQAGDATTSLLTYLVRDDPRTRMLVVGITRPPEEGTALHALVSGARSGNAAVLHVPRLAPKDVAVLLRNMLHSERLVQELGFRLMEKTEGNPFFILEVLRTLQHDRVLTRREGGGWTMASTKVEIHVPDTVRDVLAQQLAKLADEDRELLDVASVFGQEFDPELLAEVTGSPKLALLKRLTVLERKQRLIRSVGRKCRFDHPQLRETLYEGVMEALREEYHAQVGAALAKRRPPAAAALSASPAVPGAAEATPDAAGAWALELARHFVLGARHAEAAAWILPALRFAAARFDTEDVLLLGPRFLDGADGEVAPPAVRAEILLLAAAAYEHEGRPAEHAEAIESARIAAERSGDGLLLARALERALILELSRGDFDAAARVCREFVKAAAKAKSRDGVLAGLANMASALRAGGRFDEAASALRRALRFVVLAQSTLRRCVILSAAAHVDHLRGKGRSAQKAFLEAVALAKEFGIAPAGDLAASRHPERDELRDQFAGLSRALARSAEVRADAERTLLLTTKSPRRLREAAALLGLGLTACALGLHDDARGVLLGALRAAREVRDLRLESTVLHALGEASARAGAPDVARKWYEDALSIRRKIAFRPGTCETLLALGQVAALGGDVALAKQHLDEAAELAQAVEMPGLGALSRATSALLHAREGHRDRARADLAEARDALTGAGPLSVASRVEGLWFASLAAKTLGDDETARSQLERAWRMISDIAARLPESERRAYLQEQSPNREIAAAMAAAEGAGVSPSGA
ncbi:MAG: Serine/threonine-protein kinase PknD [Planctomycetes bacterium]|nr:Serine/threonine-protein kinase PknD [Planctomycetota bacterium]